MAGPTVNIKILADASQATKTLDKAGSRTGRITKSMAAAAIPLAAAGVALVGMGKAAVEDAAGQAKLAKQLATSTGATQAQVAAVEDWISKTAAASGVADDQLRPAMSTLARATGSVATSQEAMAVAMDVAAATGKPLASVTEAMAKAYAGNTTALGRLVPGLDKGVVASRDMAKITAELQRTTGGASAAAADTAAGKFARMTLALDEAKETIGGALLPLLDRLSPTLLTVAEFVQRNATVIAVLVGVVLAAKTAMIVFNAAAQVYMVTQRMIAIASNAWAVAQWALNAALAANPVGVVIIAIIALVAAVILAYKKCATFRAIVQAAWRGIAAAALWAWQNILQPVIMAVVAGAKRIWSAFATAARFVAAAARAIGAAAMWMWRSVIKPVIDFIVGYFRFWWRTVVAVKDKIVAAFRAVWQKAIELKDKAVAAFRGLASAAAAPFKAIEKIVRGALDWLQRLISKITNFKVPKWLSSVMGKAGAAIGLSSAPLYVPAPTVGVGARAGTTSRAAASSPLVANSGAAATMAHLTGENTQVVVSVPDRRLADLFDVQIRRSEQARARALTRRQVVIV